MPRSDRRKKPLARCTGCTAIDHLYPDGLCCICHSRRIKAVSREKILRGRLDSTEVKRSLDACRAPAAR